MSSKPKAKLAAETNINGVVEDLIYDTVGEAPEFIDFLNSADTRLLAMDRPLVPTEDQMRRAVEEATRDLLDILKQSGLRAPTDTELQQIVERETLAARRILASASIDGDAIERAMSRVPIVARATRNSFVLLADQQPMVMLASTTAIGREFSGKLLALDIAIEILFGLFGILGLQVGPKPNGTKLAKSLFKSIKDDKSLGKALTQLVKALDDDDPLAILKALNALRGGAILGEILAAAFSDLDYLDYAAAVFRFLLSLGAATLSGGATLALKVATFLASALEIYLKARQLGENFD